MAFGHLGTTPHVLILQQNESLERFIREVCTLEGIETKTVTTAEQAFDFLAFAAAEHRANGRKGHCWVVLIDNLQVSDEGQAFLTALRDQPGVRARLKTVCVAVTVNCEWARKDFGDVLDDYLVMPFQLEGLLDVLGVDRNE